MKKLVFAIVASVSAAVVMQSPALASEERLTVPSYKFQTSEGRSDIGKQIKAAARRVCNAGGVDHKDHHERTAYRACVAQASQQSHEQVASILAGTTLASR